MSRSDGRGGGSILGAVLEVVGLLVVAVVISLVVGIAFLVQTVALGYDLETTPVLLGVTAAGQVGFLLVAAAYVRRRRVPLSLELPSARDLRLAAAGVVVAFGLAMVLSVLLAVFDLLPSSVIDEVIANDPTFAVGLAVLSVVLVAPAEELLFRGAIQGRLRQRLGPVSAVAGSSLLFGAVHLANYAGEPVPILAGAALIAIVGTVLGALYEYTGNLAVPIATHATYNVILAALALVAP